MLDAEAVVELFLESGYRQASGVPCSILTPLINRIIEEKRLRYLAASSEGEAVGLNFGASLAGVKNLLLCQNSGLGNMVNPLTSLNYPFKVPSLMVVTWRGEPGTTDAAQHQFMGKITPGLLEKLDIPWSRMPDSLSQLEELLADADRWFASQQRPYAILMPRGLVAPYELSVTAADPADNFLGHGPPANNHRQPELSRTRAIELLVEQLQEETVVIGSTGKTGRELYAVDDREKNLYVVGGLGTASAIGCGLSLNRPDLPVVVLDGDGSALMKLGNLATVGLYQPKNLLHILLDNECHDSTGGQATASPAVSFAGVAAACNYRRVYRARTAAEYSRSLQEAFTRKGPQFIRLKIKPGSPSELPRPPFTPEENFRRLAAAIGTNLT